MKKIFLIPLMTLVCSVMAWADNEAKIGTTEYATLKAALDAASSGATVELLKDVSYTDAAGTANLNINKSLTLDGKGHTISGYSTRSGKTQYATIWINLVSPSASNVTVIFKDVKVINPKSGSNTWAIHTRGKIDSVAVVDSYLEANMTPFQIGGSQATKAKITMLNSQLKALTYYCVCSYNPYILKAENCEFNGWNALYFKGVDGSAGSQGSVATLTNCNLNCPNPYNTPTNKFGMFVCEDDGISITLDNCGMHAEQLGNQTQTVFLLSNFASKTRRSQPMNFVITGDNSYINGKLVSYSGWAAGYYNNAPSDAAIPDPCPLSITISGGTYAFNPANQGWLKNQTYETEEELYDESNIGMVTIPSGFEVKEIKTQQGEITTTLWRVRETIITPTSTDINENLQGEGDGQNDDTNFKITTDQTVSEPSVVANYIEVSEDATLTVPGGKKLEVTNGLDVSGNAEVVVEAGSTVVVGEGGIISEKPANIVIEADENGAASLLLDPAVIVNTTPNLTVKMKAKSIGWMTILGDKQYFWHRFALPIQEAATWGKSPNKATYVFGWSYAKDDWEQLSALTQMVPFKGYTLSADYENLGDIEYTFTGQLAGNTNNTLQFEHNGFNFFGNSYTGYIDILALVDQIMGDAKINGSVWVWGDDQNYHVVPLMTLRNGGDVYASEIAPMQTFIMKQNGSENATTELNYASAIWGNPRYGHSPAPAPRRNNVADETTRMRIIVKAENGKSDLVMLTEDGKFSDEYENGYDGEKYMNENALNMYATINGTDYSAVATDNLEGKTITINTLEAVNYTMSFAKVNGEEYAIRDNVTGKVIAIEEGATYDFAAQPNSIVEGRFEIVPVAKVATAIENTEVKANVKGIYTIMGQYLGEDFNALPAGVYVVNGVKIVK